MCGVDARSWRCSLKRVFRSSEDLVRGLMFILSCVKLFEKVYCSIFAGFGWIVFFFFFLLFHVFCILASRRIPISKNMLGFRRNSIHITAGLFSTKLLQKSACLRQGFYLQQGAIVTKTPFRKRFSTATMQWTIEQMRVMRYISVHQGRVGQDTPGGQGLQRFSGACGIHT